MQEKLIRSKSGKVIAILYLRDAFMPSWMHVKADSWTAYYNIRLIGNEIKTEGRFYTDRYTVSDDDRFISIEELICDDFPGDLDKCNSRLLLIDVEKALEAEVGKIHYGHIQPKYIKDGIIYYSKCKLNFSGVFHEFERSIESLKDWKKIA